VGEIGHFQVVDGGEVCYCGNRGCLETVSSTRRVVADYAHIRPGREVTLDDVVAASRAGDPAVRRILEEAGTALGRVVAMVCNLLSPDVVVLGGPLASIGQPLLDSMVVSVRQRALPGATASTVFELSSLDEEAEVRGACLLALRHLLTGS
jgi:predicted NBD/HSP70 family sugar kinase